MCQPASRLFQRRRYGNRSFTCHAFAAIVIILGYNLCSVSAQEPPATSGQPAAQSTTPAAESELEKLRKTVRQLSAEVARLKAENDKLEKYRQVDYLREQLAKEEQRVQAAQKELTDIAAKEISLQKRLDEIEPQLRPDRIEQSRAGVGSLRPEEDREAVQRQLSNEKRRIQSQLDQLQQSRPRLQNAITSAEASIQTLRQRLREAVRMAGLGGRDMP